MHLTDALSVEHEAATEQAVYEILCFVTARKWNPCLQFKQFITYKRGAGQAQKDFQDFSVEDFTVIVLSSYMERRKNNERKKKIPTEYTGEKEAKDWEEISDGSKDLFNL